MKQVIVVRKDLNMRKGKLAAQVGHAAHLVADQYRFDYRYEAWMRGKIRKIVVGVQTEDELINIRDRAMLAGLIVIPIVDSGLTEFGGVPTFTCVGIGPDADENIDPITRDLALL